MSNKPAILIPLLLAAIAGIYFITRDEPSMIIDPLGPDPRIHVTEFKSEHGRYPTNQEWSAVLFANSKIPLDPWGNPFQYRFPGTHNIDSFDMFSYGPDGIESEDDLGNWDPQT